MNRTTSPAAPAFKDLSPRRSPSTGARSDFAVSLAIVTPILGGGYRTRALDNIDIIRVPTVRGHLRFWWRALFAGRFESSASLYEAETKLWGGPGGGPGKAPAVRSPVEVRIEVTGGGNKEPWDIDPQQTDGAYVLFPARSERRGGQITREPIPRQIGVAFNLTVTAPAEDIAVVRDAVRAWILFGGYGGRTRRGLGGLTVTGPNAATWIPHPHKPLDTELKRLFGREVFAVGGPVRQTPMLAGSALTMIGRVEDRGVTAWLTAVDALRLFRQGTPPDSERVTDAAAALPSAWARQPSSDPRRPSISNWPEADKIRNLADRELGTGPYSHTPRHNDKPVWPRAGFGLPIVGRFQTKRRRGDSGDDYHEPPDFTLKWGELAGRDKYQPRERLTSPLIIKALPLVGGRFVAIALWLHRAWPAGKIILEIKGKVVLSSAAPFDALVAPGDAPLFTALADKPTLRAAFFEWLASSLDITPVFPPRDASRGTL
jgi:CRISPR-associated protein Cmr1